MNRNRFIYFTDLMLLLVFILSFYTGVELHIAGQGVDHESWHIWAIFHTNASLLFMILGIIHVKSHWAWYKGLRTVGCKGKRKACIAIVRLFFCWLLFRGYYWCASLMVQTLRWGCGIIESVFL